MQIILIDSKEVICDGNICDPIAMWKISCHCGNCPMIAFAERFNELWLEDLVPPVYNGDGKDNKAM